MPSYGNIKYNPMSKVKIIPKPEDRKRYLTQEKLSRYLSACKNHSKIAYLFVLIALATGGRYSEVLHLRVEDVDYQNERVYYLDTKNGTSRGVYLELCREPFLFVVLDYWQFNRLHSLYFVNTK